jgi:hypothetical protein
MSAGAANGGSRASELCSDPSGMLPGFKTGPLATTAVHMLEISHPGEIIRAGTSLLPRRNRGSSEFAFKARKGLLLLSGKG